MQSWINVCNIKWERPGKNLEKYFTIAIRIQYDKVDCITVSVIHTGLRHEIDSVGGGHSAGKSGSRVNIVFSFIR